jgi:hypothetical protein
MSICGTTCGRVAYLDALVSLSRGELARRGFCHRRFSLIGCGRVPECSACYDLKSDVVKQLTETLSIVVP